MSRGVEETRNAAGIGQDHIRLGTLYSLTLGSNQLLTAKLEDGYLDVILIAVTLGEIDHNRFEMLPLFDDDIFLAAPAASGLDASFPADLRDFRQQKFVSLAEGFATWQGAQQAFLPRLRLMAGAEVV